MLVDYSVRLETVKPAYFLQASVEVTESLSEDATAVRNFRLKELLTYQDEAVVSRTLINKTAGTVTVFAFGQGQELSEHTAPYDALVIVVDGEAEVRIAGESYHLAEGEMIVMPANKPHALKALTKFKMILIMIRAK